MQTTDNVKPKAEGLGLIARTINHMTAKVVSQKGKKIEVNGDSFIKRVRVWEAEHGEDFNRFYE